MSNQLVIAFDRAAEQEPHIVHRTLFYDSYAKKCTFTDYYDNGTKNEYTLDGVPNFEAVDGKLVCIGVRNEY